MAGSEQPTLSDGEVTLRPVDAGETHQFAHETALGFTFLVERASPTPGEDPHHDYGEVHLSVQPDGVGEPSWWIIGERYADSEVRALRLLVTHAFRVLGLQRVQAEVEADDVDGQRLLARVGLRREGVMRGGASSGSGRVDLVLMARLADDPDAQTRDGFIAMLNAGLPTKRVISQGVLRDRDRRILLCEMTYKREWDLPGGVIERHESPASGLQRELAEELGVHLTPVALVTVNWLPAWRGWDDACVFVFDVGVVDAELVDAMVLQPTEILAVHWCTPRQVRERAAAATARLLARIEPGTEVTPYLEDAVDRPAAPRI